MAKSGSYNAYSSISASGFLLNWEEINFNAQSYTVSFKYDLKFSMSSSPTALRDVVKNGKLTLKYSINNGTKITLLNNKTVNLYLGMSATTLASGTVNVTIPTMTNLSTFDLNIDCLATYQDGMVVAGSTIWTNGKNTLTTTLKLDGFSSPTVDYAGSILNANISETGSETVTVNIKQAYTGLKYKASVHFDNYSENLSTIFASPKVDYVPPVDWLDMMPTTNQSDKPYLKITAINNNQKQIGLPITCNFKISIDESVKPSVDSLNVEKISDIVPAEWDLLVQGNSKIKAIINKASPGRGSTLNKFIVLTNMGDLSDSDTLISDTLNSSGDLVVSAYVIDSRNRKSEIKTLNLYIEPYEKPNIVECSAQRCNSDLSLSDTGNRVLAKLDGILASCKGKNKLTKSIVEIKKNTTDEIISSESINPGTSLLLSGTYDSEYSYSAIFTVSDMLYTTQRILLVPTAKVTFDLKKGGNGFSIGKIAEYDYFECDFDAHFNRDVYIQMGNSKERLKSIIDSKISRSNIVDSLEITEPGYLIDGKTLSEALTTTTGIVEFVGDAITEGTAIIKRNGANVDLKINVPKTSNKIDSNSQIATFPIGFAPTEEYHFYRRMKSFEYEFIIKPDGSIYCGETYIPYTSKLLIDASWII